jgi:hypothetical protein
MIEEEKEIGKHKKELLMRKRCNLDAMCHGQTQVRVPTFYFFPIIVWHIHIDNMIVYT